MFKSILYYPTININDLNWLNSAVLYWDEICSISPYEDFFYNSNLQYLKQTKQYRPIIPRTFFESNHVEEFKTTLYNRINIVQSQLNNRNSLPVTNIHSEKFTDSILNELKYNDYLKDIGKKDWYEMNSYIAHIYIKTLAEYIIKYSEDDIVIGTNKMSDMDEFFTNNQCEVNELVLSLSLVNCLPKPANDANLEDIIKFKEKRKNELLVFRKKLSDIESQIAHANSIEEIEHIIKTFRHSMRQSITDTTQMLKDAKIKFVLGSLSSLIKLSSNVCSIIESIKNNYFSRQTFFDSLESINQVTKISTQYKSYRNKINLKNPDSSFAYIIQAHRENLIK